MNYQIKEIATLDNTAVRDILHKYWEDDIIVVHNDVFNALELKGIKAVEQGEIIGILHYRLLEQECEIITLASVKQGQGVGSSLISEVEKIARRSGCVLLSLTTTNDNLNALGFYQRRGFHLAALFPDQAAKSRRLKPSIPEIGENNIPIRDELRLEKRLL